MKLVSIYLSFFLVVMVWANPQLSGSGNCSCGQGYRYSAWGTFIGNSVCEGRCDKAVLVRERECHLFNNSSRYLGKEICRIKELGNCTGECDGAWASWGNIGRCSGRCGSGFQEQQRICYRVSTYWFYLLRLCHNSPLSCRTPIRTQLFSYFIKPEFLKYTNPQPTVLFLKAEWYGASVSGAVDSGLIPSRIKSMTLTLVFTAFLLDAQH